MDEQLLNLINRDWTCPALDVLMAVMSSLRFWAVPLIVLAAYAAIFGRFRARMMLVVLALTVLVSDSLVGDGLKHLIRRPRPNEVEAGVRIVTLNLKYPAARLRVSFPEAGRPMETAAGCSSACCGPIPMRPAAARSHPTIRSTTSAPRWC